MTAKPNDPEARRERMRELGRKSGEARRRKRSERRSLLDVLRGRVDESPELLVDQLLASPAGAVKAAALLERAGVFGPEPQHPATRDDIAPATHGLAAVVEFAYAQGSARELGLPTTAAELERLMARGEGGVAGEESKNHAPARRGLSVPQTAANDPPKPDGTPDPNRSSTQHANTAADERAAREAAAWQFEQARLGRVNQERAALGLAPLDEHGDAPLPVARLTPGSSANPPAPEGDSWL